MAEAPEEAPAPYLPTATEPSRTPDPVAPRRASVLSPYLTSRSAASQPGEADAAWSASPASTPIPMVGLAPALENPEYGATFVPGSVEAGGASALGEEFAVPRPSVHNPGMQGRVPRPVEVDDVEVIRPVAIPPAAEILPTTGSVPYLEPADDEYDTVRQGPHTPIGPESDPFHLLGVSAVASASLAAAGARVPAQVEWDGGEPLPTLDPPAPFVPMFDVHAPEGIDARPTHQPTAESAPAWEPEPEASAAPPPSGAGTDIVPVPHTPVSPPPPYDEGDLDSKPWWRKLWVLIVLGVVVLGGLGALTYRLFFLPEPIILPAPVVTEAPPAPTVEPVELEDPSPLLEAMPREVSTLVMTSYVSLEVLGDKDLPARASEHLTLTYGEGVAQDTFTIDVYQFYNTADAQTAFEVWVDGQTQREDVTVDGAVVGERAMVPGGAADTLAWRNETVVFVMQGPATDLLEFYSYFGL